VDKMLRGAGAVSVERKQKPQSALRAAKEAQRWYRGWFPGGAAAGLLVFDLAGWSSASICTGGYGSTTLCPFGNDKEV